MNVNSKLAETRKLFPAEDKDVTYGTTTKLTCAVCRGAKSASDHLCSQCSDALYEIASDDYVIKDTQYQERHCYATPGLAQRDQRCAKANPSAALEETTAGAASPIVQIECRGTKRRLDFGENSFLSQAEDQDLVLTVKVKSPSSAVRQKFLDAKQNGAVIELMSPGREFISSNCVITAIEGIVAETHSHSQSDAQSVCSGSDLSVVVTDVRTVDECISERLRAAEVAGTVTYVDSSSPKDPEHLPLCVYCDGARSGENPLS